MRLLSFILILVLVVGLSNAQVKRTETVTLALSGLTCDNCVTKVDKALRAVKGVKDVKVDLRSETAEVALASASVKPTLLIAAVEKAGFKAQVGGTPAKGENVEKKSCCSEGEMKDEAACEGGCSEETTTKKAPAKKN